MSTYNIPRRQKGDENIILSLRRQPVQAHQKYAFSFVIKVCEFALLHLLAWAPVISMEFKWESHSRESTHFKEVTLFGCWKDPQRLGSLQVRCCHRVPAMSSRETDLGKSKEKLFTLSFLLVQMGLSFGEEINTLQAQSTSKFTTAVSQTLTKKMEFLLVLGVV